MGNMRVLCVDDDFYFESQMPSFKYVNQLPKCGEVYTVNEQIVIYGQPGLVLKEIFSGMHPSGEFVSFRAKRFVPLNDEKLETIKLKNESLLFNVN